MFYHLGGEKTTGRGEEGSPLISCARATRGLGRPSLDARSGDNPNGPTRRVAIAGVVKHRSSFGVPPLGELTPSAERRSLSLALEPAAAPCSTRSDRNGSWHHYLAEPRDLAIRSPGSRQSDAAVVTGRTEGRSCSVVERRDAVFCSGTELLARIEIVHSMRFECSGLLSSPPPFLRSGKRKTGKGGHRSRPEKKHFQVQATDIRPNVNG